MKPSSRHLPSFSVAGDARGLVNHAGSAALHELARRLGYTSTLAAGLDPLRGDRALHGTGQVLTDLAVCIADGGDGLSDLRTLQDQPDLFGRVASVPTASRVVRALTEAALPHLREARRHLRAEAWRRVGPPQQVVLDIDATLVTVHSKKEQAAGTFKRGFGFHPLLCFLDGSGEALAGILRPGNANANTATDHIEVLELACQQLPELASGQQILVRCDAAGGTHKFLHAVRARGNARFSVGYGLREGVRTAIAELGEKDWLPALGQDGEPREVAQVAELRSLDLGVWPSGSRVICRRERVIEGSQLDLVTDHGGWRHQVFITDQEDQDIAVLEARHRARAHCEDAIRCAKETGLGGFPFQGFVQNQIWLELVLAAHDLLCHFRALALQGAAQRWEPKTLRYRLLHTGARMVRQGRRRILRLSATWPWTELLATAFAQIRSLPAP